MVREQQLNYQASRIEMVLASYRVPGRVCGGLVTPRLIRFQFVPQIGTRLNRLKALSEEIALSLGVPSCRIQRQDGAVHIDLAREDAGNVRLLPLCKRLTTLPPCSPLLGLDEEGFPLVLSLPAPEVSHVLISGTTGSGKTALARTMITSLAIHNHQGMLQLVLIDVKRRGFGVFQQLPHLLCPVAQSPEEAMSVLSKLVAEMERRDELDIVSPRVVVFIDELAELMIVAGREAEIALTRLMQRGREAGLHLVACTQKPLAGVIGSLVKANFPARVVGKVTSADDARVASGVARTGAEKLDGHGSFLVIAGGKQVRMQGAWITEGEIRRVIRWLRAGKRRRHWDGDSDEGPLPALGRRLRHALPGGGD